MKTGNPWTDVFRFRDFFVADKPMVIKDLYYFASMAYFASWISIFLNRKTIGTILLFTGLALNAGSMVLRYYYAWPLLPMYQGPFFLPFVIGLLSVKTILGKQNHLIETRLHISLICFMAISAVFFPKDFYVPFLRSKTLFSYCYFLLGVIGKAFFLIAGISAILHFKKSFLPKTDQQGYEVQVNKKVVWGFAFWTLSMFSAEMWSYLGWGAPVVWDDPAITTTMAGWFYYGCFLHLHLFRSWNTRKRSAFAFIGAVVVFAFNCLSDMGAFHWPQIGSI